MTGAEDKRLTGFLEDVSKAAGGLALSYFRGEYTVDRKDFSPGGIDIVTDADRASERLILDALAKEFPDHDVLTEETVTNRSGSRYLWLVDPLDGTINFAHGLPHFCVTLALMCERKLLAGIVYDPIREERFQAVSGAGATLNGKPIHVSRAKRLTESIVGTGFPYDRAYSEENNVAEFSRIVTRVQGVRRAGSAALDLAYVGCGRLDGFWELKLKPWDQGAGMLIVEEAGGRVSDRFGSETDAFTTHVVATNGLIHGELLGLL